jgi:hypothetical protein
MVGWNKDKMPDLSKLTPSSLKWALPIFDLASSNSKAFPMSGKSRNAFVNFK